MVVVGALDGPSWNGWKGSRLAGGVTGVVTVTPAVPVKPLVGVITEVPHCWVMASSCQFNTNWVTCSIWSSRMGPPKRELQVGITCAHWDLALLGRPAATVKAI